jgi:hypothetical protein
VLARLSQINGVDSSFANEAGSLVGLSLRPGADPRQVAREAQRALSEEVTQQGSAPPQEKETAPLGGREAAAALESERWHDRDEVARQAAEIVAAERQAPEHRFPWLLLALLLGVAVGLMALWRHRRAVVGYVAFTFLWRRSAFWRR